MILQQFQTLCVPANTTEIPALCLVSLILLKDTHHLFFYTELSSPSSKMSCLNSWEDTLLPGILHGLLLSYNSLPCFENTFISLTALGDRKSLKEGYLIHMCSPDLQHLEGTQPVFTESIRICCMLSSKDWLHSFCQLELIFLDDCISLSSIQNTTQESKATSKGYNVLLSSV